MIASQVTHSPTCECSEELSLYRDASPRLAKGGSKNAEIRRAETRRIVSLNDEIVFIEGTLSVAF